MSAEFKAFEQARNEAQMAATKAARAVFEAAGIDAEFSLALYAATPAGPGVVHGRGGVSFVVECQACFALTSGFSALRSFAAQIEKAPQTGCRCGAPAERVLQ